MNREDIIRMAREAAGEPAWDDGVDWVWGEVERFAALVAAAEREKWKWEELHTCHPHCDRPACVAVRRAREDEREACAKVVEEWLHGEWHNQGVIAALMIRERGAP
jgi:GNAT superfamily N-acetyltransferase